MFRGSSCIYERRALYIELFHKVLQPTECLQPTFDLHQSYFRRSQFKGLEG